MVDRLRVLLDRPLDPSGARAIVALSNAILLGLAALFLLAGGEPGGLTARKELRPVSPSPVLGVPAKEIEGSRSRHRPTSTPQQDPQDIEGSGAARRADRALRTHRALQHVPYRDGGVTIALAGARGSRAVLRVSAATTRAARLGWRQFLRRYRDSGRSYIPLFRNSTGDPDGQARR